MENQVEVLETSDVSNEEINEIFQELERIRSSTTEVFQYADAQEHSAEIAGVSTQVLDNPSEEKKEEESIPQPKEPIIPPNSPTLLIEESSSRFSSAIWYDAVRTKSIVLAGVGGIGRFGNLKIYYYLCA